MIRSNRTTRDTQTLAGQRGTPGQRAVLWQEVDQLAQQIAAKLLSGSFGKQLSPFIKAASVDQEALEKLLNRSREIERINQLFDSTTTYINNEAQRLDEEGAARDDLITQVNVRVDDAEAAILAESIARSDGETALAQDINTVSADLNTAEAEVQTVANAIATIEGYQAATYAIRLKSGGASAGFEMVTADDPINGAASAIRFNADDVLFDGTIFADHINAASFASAGLAVFGGAVQSSNYLSGVRGWRITQAGDAEFINLIAREAIINGEILTAKLADSSVTRVHQASGSGSQSVYFYPTVNAGIVVVASAQVTKTASSGTVTASAQLRVNGGVYATGSALTANNQDNGSTSSGSVAMTTSFATPPQGITVSVTGDVTASSIAVFERFK